MSSLNRRHMLTVLILAGTAIPIAGCTTTEPATTEFSPSETKVKRIDQTGVADPPIERIERTTTMTVTPRQAQGAKK